MPAPPPALPPRGPTTCGRPQALPLVWPVGTLLFQRARHVTPRPPRPAPDTSTRHTVSATVSTAHARSAFPAGPPCRSGRARHDDKASLGPPEDVGIALTLR